MQNIEGMLVNIAREIRDGEESNWDLKVYEGSHY
jgi:hypothetical protein